MESLKDKTVLISGASIAGLSTAYFMNQLGYRVTVIEQANEPRTTGAAVDFRGQAVEVAKRMGIYDQLKLDRLNVELVQFKSADDVTQGSIQLGGHTNEPADEEIEIERDKFVAILYGKLKNEVEFVFNDSVTALDETQNEIKATFKSGDMRFFDLILGCDGLHSVVRKIWFGHEADYAHFLNAYFSITIVNKLLVRQKTMQMFNVPDKSIMLNAYNNKTDIIFCFYSDNEIAYNYRDTEEQRKIISEHFSGQGWRTPELLTEIADSKNFYFDKFCQVKMPSWTKGRVALVGDAGYSASPAAGMGGSLAMIGAAAVTDAIKLHNGNFELAFAAYNRNLRPFMEEVQATAESNIKNNFIPRTEEAIHKRNTQTTAF